MKQLEEKLKVAVADNELLVKNNKRLKSSLQQLQSQLNEIKMKNDLLSQQLQQFYSTHTKKSISNSATIELDGQLVQFQEFKLFEKDKEIKYLQQNCQDKIQEISQLRALLQLSNFQQTQSNFETCNSEQEIIKLKEISKQQLKENDELQLARKQEAQFRIELEHLRAENQVFQQLLGFTPTLENNGNYQHNPNSVPLKLLLKTKYPIHPDNQTFDYCQNCNREIYLYRSCCNPLQQLNDKLLYVPGDCYNFASQFKEKYLNSKNDLMVEELLEILLFELNKIWQQREKNNLLLLANHCKDKIKEIQRHNSRLTSYNEKDQIMQLKRLKSQITLLQNENLEQFANKFTTAILKI